MRVLVTSVDSLFNFDEQEFYDGIVEALDDFLSLNDSNRVYVISISKAKLSRIPPRFRPNHVSGQSRQSGAVTNFLRNVAEFERSDVCILGAKEGDFRLAVNEKVLLLGANYISGRKDDKILTYGRPIPTTAILTQFLRYYSSIENPWFYKLQVDDVTTLLALTDANTFYASEDVTEMNERFKACLKAGVDTYRELFLNYFLMSVYSGEYYEEFSKVDYWSIYPSSGTTFNNDLHPFMEVVRTLFKAKPQADNTDRQLLVRIVNTHKRHYKTETLRVQEGTTLQIASMRVNPIYANGRLRGASVCIIDDYTTFGSSCETVRALLRPYGVARILFVAIGKYGKKYYKYTNNNVELLGDYEINNTANRTLIDSLSGLIKTYGANR